MENLYFIWLSLIFSFGTNKPIKILDIFNSPKLFYENIPNNLKELDFLSDNEIKRLKLKSLSEAEYIVEQCKKYNINLISYDDPKFPVLLKNLHSPPMVLYYRGDISYLNDSLCISMVGTRNPTDYGKYISGNLSYQLARSGVCIISGCAVGIDSMAHIGALKAGGKTVAILGCGLDINYPAIHMNLKEDIILNNGALISEFPPGTGIKNNTFPIRNRIISGISRGVVIVESPVRGGSLITAGHAVDQNRDLFCIPPHNIYDSRYQGVVNYLKDGAIPVYSYKDILIEYKDFKFFVKQTKKNDTKSSDSDCQRLDMVADFNSEYKTLITHKTDEIKKGEEINSKSLDAIVDLDENSFKVYNSLSKDGKHLEIIVQQSGLNLNEVLSILTELEILGIIIAYSGNRYGLSNLEKGDK